MRPLRAAAKRLLHAGGVYRRRLAVHPFEGVAVLAYHGVRPDGTARDAMTFGNLHVTTRRLDEQCRVLRELCTPISLSQWREARRTGSALPPCAVLVTFDDGYRSVLTRALPVLERYQIPAVVFACSMPIERRERFWFDALAARDGEHAVNAAKKLLYGEWRQAVDAIRMPVTDDDPHAPLRIDEVRELSRHPLIEIGSHTTRHPILAAAPIERQREEIHDCRRALENWTGQAVRAFAYPNGRAGLDYTAETVAQVATSGADVAFAIDQAFANGQPVYEQPRFLMLDSIDGPDLAHRLVRSWRSSDDAPPRSRLRSLVGLRRSFVT